MNERKILGVVLCAAWLFGLAGCGAGAASGTRGESSKVRGDRVRVSHSEGVEPLWIQECPAHSDQTLPFCGEAHEKASQAAACAEATADALGKLHRFIGQKVDAKLEPDGAGGYRFALQGLDSEPITVRGVWESDRWAEEFEGRAAHTHDCWVMVTYPKLEYDLLRAKGQAVLTQRAEKARSLHAEGKQLGEQGRWIEARVNFERARDLLADLKEPVVTQAGLNSDMLKEQVLADLKRALEEEKALVRTFLVVSGLTVDGKPLPAATKQRDLDGPVQGWLTKEWSFKVRPGGLSKAEVESVLSGDAATAAQVAASKGAGLLLVIEAEAEHVQDPGDPFHYVYTQGSLRLVRTADGREVATAKLERTKGAHPHKVQLAVSDSIKKWLSGQVRPALESAVKGL